MPGKTKKLVELFVHLIFRSAKLFWSLRFMGIYIKLYSKVICVCAMGLVLGIESCYTYNGCHSLLLSLGVGSNRELRQSLPGKSTLYRHKE